MEDLIRDRPGHLYWAQTSSPLLRPVSRWDGTVHERCEGCGPEVIRMQGGRTGRMQRFNVVTPHATPSTIRTGYEVKQPGRKFGPVPLTVIRHALRGQTTRTAAPMTTAERYARYQAHNAMTGRRGTVDVFVPWFRENAYYQRLTPRQARQVARMATRSRLGKNK